MTGKLDLKILTKDLEADGAIVVNSKGKLTDAINVKNDGNIAAMTSVVYTMIGELTSDLGIGEIEQVTCKSKDGIYVVDKFDAENIVCVFSKDVTKVGYLMMTLKSHKSK